jgi:hypothetical protein
MLQLEGIYLYLETKIKQMKKIISISVLIILIVISVFFYRYKTINIIQQEKNGILYEFENYCLENGIPESKKEFENFIIYVNQINTVKYKSFNNEYSFERKKDSVTVSVKNMLNFNDKKFNVIETKIDTSKICDEYRLLKYLSFNQYSSDGNYLIFNKRMEAFINENYDTISTNNYNVIDFKEKLRFKKLLFTFKNNKIACKCNDNLNEKLTVKIKTDLNSFFNENPDLKNNKYNKNFGFILHE